MSAVKKRASKHLPILVAGATEIGRSPGSWSLQHCAFPYICIVATLQLAPIYSGGTALE